MPNGKVNKHKSQFNGFLATLAILGLAILIIPALAFAQSYVEPNAGPPFGIPTGGSNLEFLNSSSATQTLTGSLLIGERNGVLSTCTTGDSTGCAKLCLNADTSKWTNDAQNCIAQWGDLAAIAGGPFLRLLTGAELALQDRGFTAIHGDGLSNHLISLLAVADPSASGAAGFQANSTSTSYYAGQFQGKVVVKPETGTSEICLNGNCISSWLDPVGGAPSDATLLQSGTPYFSPQAGNVGLNGPLIVGSLVTGTPTAGTATIYTCGDGLCSSQNGENAFSCSADCL